jgi:hypothetical protein
MISEEKIVEIKRKLKKGYPQGELINDLTNEGYTSEEILQALYSLSEKNTINKKINNTPLWYAVSIGFIILGIAILSVKYLWIYYYGYVFLVLGIAGLIIKQVVANKTKKNRVIISTSHSVYVAPHPVCSSSQNSFAALP